MIEVRTSAIDRRGIFATQPIKKGTHILEYEGEWITKEEGEKRCDEHIQLAASDPSRADVLIFDYDETWDIDGSVDWNTAKYLNHSCEPNCEAVDYEGSIWFKAVRDIQPGEEITFDYGYDESMFDGSRCKCQSPKCIGYMLGKEYWDKLPKLLEGLGK